MGYGVFWVYDFLRMVVFRSAANPLNTTANDIKIQIHHHHHRAGKTRCYKIETYGKHHRFLCYWTMNFHIRESILLGVQRRQRQMRRSLCFLWIEYGGLEGRFAFWLPHNLVQLWIFSSSVSLCLSSPHQSSWPVSYWLHRFVLQLRLPFLRWIFETFVDFPEVADDQVINTAVSVGLVGGSKGFGRV